MNLQKIRQATELLDSKLIDLQEWTVRCLGEDYRGVWSEEYLRRCAVFVRNMLNGADDCESDENDAEILSQKKFYSFLVVYTYITAMQKFWLKKLRLFFLSCY